MIADPPFAALVCPAHRTGALSAWPVRMRVPKSAARIALRTIALLLALSFLLVSTARAQLPTYPAGFTPSGLTLNGSAALSGTRLRLTNGGAAEAGSAFFNTRVNVQSFVTDFSFQLTNATADGFTFTIQGNSGTALGGNGGCLGYGSATGTGSMGNSVAVGFQLYSTKLGNIKVSLTGDWTNGACPSATPGSDMSASGVNLHSGDKMTVHMTYDGTTLTWKVTDTVTGKSFTKSVAINIPSYVGGNTAYVGFTGGTGGLAATQDILNWTYNPNASASPDFSFSASPSTESVAAGLQASYTVTVTPQNGFAGSVGLSAGTLPSGVTASFNPASITGSGTSTLTVFTPCSSSDSTSTLTLTGTSGSLSHSMLATLTVSGDPNCQAALLVVNPLNSSLDNIATELHGMPIQDSQPAPQSVAGM
jgi:hypothetical protein